MVRKDVDANNPADGAHFEAKVRAEVAAADALCPGADAIRSKGSPAPAVVLVKGAPGAADRERGVALAGDDGKAARQALEALGVTGAVFAMCSRPEPALPRGAVAERVRLIVEALDPAAVIALDLPAAEDLAAAFSISPLLPGVAVAVNGRTLLAVEDLEGSLADEEHKRDVWHQLQGLTTARAGEEKVRGTRRRPEDEVLF